MLLAEKVRLACEMLGINASQPVPLALNACNEALGLPATGSLLAQADELLTQLGLPVPSAAPPAAPAAADPPEQASSVAASATAVTPDHGSRQGRLSVGDVFNAPPPARQQPLGRLSIGDARYSSSAAADRSRPQQKMYRSQLEAIAGERRRHGKFVTGQIISRNRLPHQQLGRLSANDAKDLRASVHGRRSAGDVVPRERTLVKKAKGWLWYALAVLLLLAGAAGCIGIGVGIGVGLDPEAPVAPSPPMNLIVAFPPPSPPPPFPPLEAEVSTRSVSAAPRALHPKPRVRLVAGF